MHRPMSTLIGHRGLPTAAPENTRSSILAAQRAGIDWLELDVTMAGDQSLVIMHDADLALFGKPGIRLADLDRAYLLKVDAGGWFGANFSGEPLLFLEQLLPLITRLNLGLNLEIKINPDLPMAAQVDAIHAQLTVHRAIGPQLLVSSFHHDALRRLRQLQPAVQLAPLFETLPDDALAATADLQPVAIHCDHRRLTAEQAAHIGAQLPLYCYTVNDAETLRRLLNLGVSGVFSDRANAADLIAEVDQASGV